MRPIQIRDIASLWTWMGCALGGLLAVGCLVYSAWNQAPVNDEFGHFYAGLRYWQFGDKATFKVNSPLLRSLTTLPAYLAGMECGRSESSAQTMSLGRPEFNAGRQLFIADPPRFQFWLSFGRMAVVLTTILGAGILFLIATHLCDWKGGALAAGLWLFQPQILSHGVLITGDAFCAVCMLATVGTMNWTLKRLTLGGSLALGCMLGVSILAKFTAVVLLPITVLAFTWHADRYSLRRLLGCQAVALLIAIFVLGVPYGFAGWGKSLWDYHFLSGSFADLQSQIKNLFLQLSGMQTLPLPVPLPEQLLLGLDRQQVDFEDGLASYAAGLRDHHGWWWFYLFSMLVKLPLGTLWCIAVTVVLLIGKWKLLAPGLGLPLLALSMMVLVTCLQSGFAQQHRYILPAYPFLFLIIGVVASRALTIIETFGRISLRAYGWSIVAGAAMTVVGSMSVAPHWLSAFNALAGGNHRGFKCLFNDASDWGQDSYRVRDWINAHQGPAPIYLRSQFSGHGEISAVGASQFEELQHSVDQLPRPCWLVVSKSDYAIDGRLEQQLDPLTITETIAGTHVAYYLP